jgi:hypothetical protein
MSPMSWTNPLGSLADLVLLIIGLAQLAALVFSLTHAIRVRSDAFGAAAKQSKMFWVSLLAVSLVLRLTISIRFIWHHRINCSNRLHRGCAPCN